MGRRGLVAGLLGAALIAVAAFTATAQETHAPPVLNELALEYINVVVVAAQAEQDALDALKLTDAYKKYEARQKAREQLQKDRTARIEKLYPGYTIDWTKRAIVTKEKK